MSALPSVLAAHLLRLGVWSAVCLVVGIVGISTVKDANWRAFFMMTAGWAAVNGIIALASRTGAPPKAIAPFREFLWLNMGLNVAYIAVGITMALLAGDRGQVRFTGGAVAIQGLGLLVLDGILLRLAPSA
ncbi:hypothetical protein BH11ARM1_BH11ARM1_09600 [soil metagenome]